MSDSIAAFTPQIHEIVARLSDGMVERDQTLRVALLGSLAGENVLLVGPPGTAKSLLARRMAGTFSECQYFQYMLTRFTSPDELFGPVSLKQLKERDEFRRKVDGYLPNAEVAFIDEIFKASSAILNSLLTLLNERLYFNGGEVVRSPLLVLIAASNEVPEEDELAALYDRFTVRLTLNPIVDEDNVLRMLRHPDPGLDWTMAASLRLTPTDVQRIRQDAKETTLTPAAEKLILRVKREIEALAAQDPQDPWRYYVSDRRWRQAVRFMRTSAWLNGRDYVHPVDCALLRHCLWNRVEDESVILRCIEGAFDDANMAFGLDLDSFVQRWMRLLSEMRDREGISFPIFNGYVLTHGGQRLVMSDLRAADLMQGSFESVRGTGFYCDPRTNTLRRVRLRQDGTFLFNVGFGTQPVPDAPTFAALVRAGNTPQYEEGAVQVERRTSPGMSLDFGAAPQALRDMYDRELGRIRIMLEEIESDRHDAVEEVDALMREHLFVPQGDVRALRSGLVRTELVVREWQVKVQTLAEAVRSGGVWETTDIDLSGDGARATGAPVEGGMDALLALDGRAR